MTQITYMTVTNSSVMLMEGASGVNKIGDNLAPNLKRGRVQNMRLYSTLNKSHPNSTGNV